MLVVQHLDSAFGFIDAQHFHKTVAFRAVGMLVVNHFYAAHGANAFEQFLDVRLRCFIRQIADIKAAGLDLAETGFAAFPWRPWFTGFARSSWFGRSPSIARIRAGSLFFAASFGGGFIAGSRAVLFLLACRTLGFLVETEEFEEFLPQAELLRCFTADERLML